MFRINFFKASFFWKLWHARRAETEEQSRFAEGINTMAPNIRLKAPSSSLQRGKLHISFDESARREHLNGFSKRKEERRRYGLAMGELKRKRQAWEERKERRELKEEDEVGLQSDGSLAVIDEMVFGKAPQAPVTTSFDDSLTHNMFGGDVVVTTTLDSLGSKDLDELEEEEQCERRRQVALEKATAAAAAKRDKGTGRASGSGAGTTTDIEQRFAYSFNAVKAKIDATTLSTKRQRKAQRNKAQMHLDNKMGGAGKKSKVSHNGSNKKQNVAQLAAKAIKTDSFGKKKFRTRNAKKK